METMEIIEYGFIGLHAKIKSTMKYVQPWKSMTGKCAVYSQN